MRVRESFTHEKGISTPYACHKGWQFLIECANQEFNIIYFPFYIYFPFLCLFIFWGRQGCFLCSYVSSGAMRNSDLRSSLSLKVCLLNWFYLFWKTDFNCEQKSSKVLDLKTIFWFFWKEERIIKALDL